MSNSVTSCTVAHQASLSITNSQSLLKLISIEQVMPSNHLISGHRTGKGPFSFQSQRKARPKNVQTTLQLCSFHMLERLCLKPFNMGFSSMWTKNFQMYKLDLGKAEEREIKLTTFIGSWRNQIPEKHLILLHWLNWSLWLCGSQQTMEDS